jgi:hypothetical protein
MNTIIRKVNIKSNGNICIKPMGFFLNYTTNVINKSQCSETTNECPLFNEKCVFKIKHTNNE